MLTVREQFRSGASTSSRAFNVYPCSEQHPECPYLSINKVRTESEFRCRGLSVHVQGIRGAVF